MPLQRLLLLTLLLSPALGTAAEPPTPIVLKPLAAADGGYEYPQPLIDEEQLRILVPRGEGWVQFAARISASGTVQDVQVVRATGDAAQIAYVLERVKAWRWKPAQSGGQAVEGTALRRVVFRPESAIAAKADGAVARGFAEIILATQRGDRAAAEASLATMLARPERNSAELTLQQVAASRIHGKWGQPLDEYLALQQALAGGEAAFAALPPNFRRLALMDELRLLLALGRYADARRAGAEALRAAQDDDTKSRISGALAKVDDIAATTTPTRMVLALGPTGLESVGLLRRQFMFAAGGEAVSEARLFCREGAMEIPLQAGARFQIDAEATECRVHLVGTPRARVDIEEQ